MRQIIILLLIIFLGYGAYTKFIKPHAGADGAPAAAAGGGAPVTVAAAIQRNVIAWDEFSGRLTAVDHVDIRPRVSGTIDQIHFQDGQMVKKNDVLITIDPRPFEAALVSAQARYGFAKAELERNRQMFKQKAVAESTYDEKKDAFSIAQADLTKAKLDLGYTQIKAPLSGRVSRAEVTTGNLVDAGSNAPILTSIVSLDPIYADFDIDEKTYVKYLHNANNDVSQLSNIPVTMGLAGEAPDAHAGKIHAFDNELNTASGSIRVRAVFDNPSGTLIPGLFAKLRLGGGGEQSSILIQEKAIGTDQNRKFVLVVGDDHIAQYREITPGSAIGNMRVVEKGLEAGEKIVVNGLQRARPGSPVTPQEVPMDEALAAAQTTPSGNAP